MKLKKIAVMLLIPLLLLCGCSVNSAESRGQSPDSMRGSDYSAGEGELEELVIYSFKAGKADAHLIYNSSMAVLIDCGEKGFGKEIVAYLQEHNIKALDMLIVSHFDKDHVGGAARVIKDIDVKRVFQTNYIKDNKEYTNYVEALAEKQITPETPQNRKSIAIGGAEISICPPLKDFYQDSPSNNASLAAVIRYGSCSLMFTGDAEEARLGELINTEGQHYDYLKVPYHGHFQQKLAPFLQLCSPNVAVITCSDQEPEDQQVMKLLSEDGAAAYLTRRAPVIARCDGKAVTASYDE